MTKLFVYNPTHPEAKSGIVKYDIICATIRLTGEEKGLVRFIISEDGAYFHIDHMQKQLLDSVGNLRKIENALAAEEGTEFRGWNNSKQYRLTKDEINFFVLENEEPIKGGMKRIYKVFTPIGVEKVLPSRITGETQYRGILKK